MVGGGQPTPEELAALAVALMPVAVAGDRADAQPSGWLRAALLEGIGERPFCSVDELGLHAPAAS